MKKKFAMHKDQEYKWRMTQSQLNSGLCVCECVCVLTMSLLSYRIPCRWEEQTDKLFCLSLFLAPLDRSIIYSTCGPKNISSINVNHILWNIRMIWKKEKRKKENKFLFALVLNYNVMKCVLFWHLTSQKIPDREIIREPSCPILCESYNPPMCCENPSGYKPHFHFCCLRLISEQDYCSMGYTSKWKENCWLDLI